MTESKAPALLRQQHASLITMAASADVPVLATAAVDQYMAEVEKSQQPMPVKFFRARFGKRADKVRAVVAGTLGYGLILVGFEIASMTAFGAYGAFTAIAGIVVLVALMRRGRWRTVPLTSDGTYIDESTVPASELSVPGFVVRRLHQLAALSPDLKFTIRIFNRDPVVCAQWRGELIYIAVYENDKEIALPRER